MCNFNKILMPKGLTPHSQSRSSHALVLCSYGWANGQLSRRRCVPSSVLLQEFDLESWSPDGLVPPQAHPRGWLHAPTATTAHHRSAAQPLPVPARTFLHQGLYLLHLTSVLHPDWQKTSLPGSSRRTTGGQWPPDWGTHGCISHELTQGTNTEHSSLYPLPQAILIQTSCTSVVTTEAIRCSKVGPCLVPHGSALQG